MRFEFDWDPAKADSNWRKHGVAFAQAMGIFNDPLALSRLDDESGAAEERWVTMGRNAAQELLLAVHTYRELAADRAAIRIMSARRPTRREIRSYENG
ncbi:membrane protein [Bradyrhizobium sp. SSBR45G]|uniref:BrnT family toxin n=1 Tax=unclassified Bradyrhizobium TaxID=2631580 RepID=UPI0023429207|nr:MULTISPECIES: BrnT family toxin [unclassified Bradyrhizobium]GLH75810.1 membrane protein [Bradyrhizobium sp. SSBR45G]GLH85047.1 membrane protein [Bradyrhizobium sp. SSBR45R]